MNSHKMQFIQRILIFLMFFPMLSGGFRVYGLHAEESGKKKWSLSDLYQRALDLSETIKIADNDLRIAEKDKDRAFSVLVPRITAFGGYTRYDEEKTLFPKSDWNWGVRFDQSFTLNGKELIALDMANDQIEKADLDLAAIRETYLFQVASAYFSFLNAVKRETIAEADVKRLEAHREAVLIQLELENTQITELYSTEATLSGARTELVIAKNNIHISRATLKRMVDLPQGFELELPDNSETEAVDQDIREIKQFALEQREDLQSMKIAHKLTESNIRLSKGSYWPTLSLEGGYTAIESSPDTFTPDDDYLFIGAKINFPIYDGGLRNAELGQARIRSKQAELRVKDYSKQIAVEVESAYRNVKTAESAIQSLQDKYKWADENFNAVTFQYQNGIKDSLDVIDADTLLANAERELAEARYNYSVSLLDLQRAKGILLKNIVEQYNLKIN
ncbi:MAG: TolC family protein [Pseudomonadota bacterium]